MVPDGPVVSIQRFGDGFLLSFYKKNRTRETVSCSAHQCPGIVSPGPPAVDKCPDDDPKGMEIREKIGEVVDRLKRIRRFLMA